MKLKRRRIIALAVLLLPFAAVAVFIVANRGVAVTAAEAQVILREGALQADAVARLGTPTPGWSSTGNDVFFWELQDGWAGAECINGKVRNSDVMVESFGGMWSRRAQ